MSFINSDGKVETWEFQGGTFTDVEWVKNGNWEQIPNQKQLNELDKNINSLTFSYDEGVGIVNSKGDIDKSYTSFNYKVTPVYKCKSGDIFKYKGRGEGQGASVIFYSGNKAVSSNKINNVKDFVDIVIENGVDGVKFASINNVGAGDVILSVRSRYFLTKEDDLFSLSDKTDAQIKDLEATANNATDKVDSLNSNVQDLQRTTTFVVDIEKGIGFIQENGDPNPVAQNMRYKKTNRITCFKDDIFQYKGHQEGQSVSYLFYNNDDIISAGKLGNSVNTFAEVIIPENVTHVVFASFKVTTDTDSVVLDIKFKRKELSEQDIYTIVRDEISKLPLSPKKMINRGINFIGHSIWQNNKNKDKFADDQTVIGYQDRILERFDFKNGWRQHAVSGSSLRSPNYLANVAKLDAKENDIWLLDTFVNEGYNQYGVGTYDDFLAHDMESDITNMTYMGALGRFAKIVEDKSGKGAIIVASDNLYDPHTAENKLRYDNLAALIEVCKRQGWYFCSQMTQSGYNEQNYTFLSMNGGYVAGKYDIDTSIYVGDGTHPNNIGYSMAVRPWLQILEEIWFRDQQTG